MKPHRKNDDGAAQLAALAATIAAGIVPYHGGNYRCTSVQDSIADAAVSIASKILDRCDVECK